jgi:predicted nucleotidyltransferase
LEELLAPCNSVLDHYYVRTTGNCYGVIVGNDHTPYYYIGYLKYCPSSGETYWWDGVFFYERLVKTYEPFQVYKHAVLKEYIPFYDAYVPIIPISAVNKVYDPRVRAEELIVKPVDALEAKASSLIQALQDCTGLSSGIGVTGSILPRIHNPAVSDIDIVVYGWRESLKVIECVRESDMFQSFPEPMLIEWSSKLSETTGLPAEDVRKLYRKYRRGVFNGALYSIMYVSQQEGNVLSKPPFKTLGEIILSGVVKGGLEALSYPSRARLESCRVLESSIEPPYDVVEIQSFESLYTPILFEGGSILVRGLLQCSDRLESCRVLIGGVEGKGFVKPAS